MDLFIKTIYNVFILDYENLQQRIFDLLTINLNMEPTFIVETMGLEWTSELTFAENVPALIKQFKKERGLKPFKVIKFNSIYLI